MQALKEFVKKELENTPYKDNSHDFSHFIRVSSLACQFAVTEGANQLVVYAASLLHDIVNLPKNHPDSYKSSWLSAERAREILPKINFPEDLIDDVCHAIHAHSFSAKVECRSLEAKCVQDADRMEAIGALGLMRTLYTCGKMDSSIMHPEDPWGLNRPLDDKKYCMDHFPLKLLTLHSTMKTEAGRKKAESRTHYLEEYRNNLINGDKSHHHIAEIFCQAGKENISLFHPEDPICEERAADPLNFALDILIRFKEDLTVGKFLDQIKEETKILLA